MSTLVPGVYIMRNLKSGTLADLSAGDHKSLVGWPSLGAENQQWELGILGEGWYIRSMRTGSYLTIEKGLGDGCPVVANNHPVSWMIKNEPDEGEDVFRIFWPNTSYSFEIDHGCSTQGTLVNLGSEIPGAKHQLWQMERCPDKDNRMAKAATVMEADAPGATAVTATPAGQARVKGPYLVNFM